MRAWSPAGAAALALTLLAHGGLLYAARTLPERAALPASAFGAAGLPPALPVAPVQVRLLAAPEPAPPRAPDSVPLAVPAPPAALPAPLAESAMTVPPTVADGLAGVLLVVPGIVASNVSVQFWIDEHGQVERFELGAHPYGESDYERVAAALRKVRFHPARAGERAIASALQLNLLVASEAGW